MNSRKNTESKNPEVAKIKNRNKGKIQKIKETGNSRYIYLIEQDKICFQFHVVNGDFNKAVWKNSF